MKNKILTALLTLFSLATFAQQKQSLTVHFNFNKYELGREAIFSLDSLIKNTSPASIVSVELNGYCDSKGSDPYNINLSFKRIESVKDYLVNKDFLKAASFINHGLGEKNLLNQDISEADGFENRRVEIILHFKKANPVEEIIPPTKSLGAMLEDTAAKKGTVITLQNLEFENNSDQLLASSNATISELIRTLIKNPSLKISIEGHICCVPQTAGKSFKETANFQISVLRAKKVYDMLQENGVLVNRMSYSGFGSSRPVFAIPEKSEEERMANRRVEIRIIEK